MLTDGDGGRSNLPTKTVNVVAVNDAPVIANFDGAVTYRENSAPVTLDSNATVSDIDSDNFAGGQLTVTIFGAQSADRLGIKHIGSGASALRVSGDSVSYGGVEIGTFVGSTRLIVTLNENATARAVQTLLRAVTFSSLSENPSTQERTVRTTLTDGDGGISNLPTKTVQVAGDSIAGLRQLANGNENESSGLDLAFSSHQLSDELLNVFAGTTSGGSMKIYGKAIRQASVILETVKSGEMFDSFHVLPAEFRSHRRP